MKNLQLINSAIVVSFLLIIMGCENEPCLDIEELDKKSSTTKEWFVDDSISNKTITDKNGISQSLVITARDLNSYDISVEDDCGNIYGSFHLSIQYRTTLSPLHFMVDIHGSGASDDGFYLTLTVTDTNSEGNKATTYNFVTESCEEDNAIIQVINGNLIHNNIDSEVLKIDFKATNASNDIKTVYYAKGHGIIKFVEENGNEFEIQ